MKAIIKVKKGSAYAKLNGFTYEVAELTQRGVSLIGPNQEFPQNSVWFSYKEIIIVDLISELTRVYLGENNKSNQFKVAALETYCRTAKIKLQLTGAKF